MSEYMRTRRGDEGNEGFFCRFTFGQFFAILVLEVFTLFFVFYLGARYGREFLGLDRKAEVASSAPAEGEEKPEGPTVLSTSDPEAAELQKELVAKAQTPELKDRISRMFEAAQGEGKAPEAAKQGRAAEPPKEKAENPVVISGGEERPAAEGGTLAASPGSAQGRPAPAPGGEDVAGRGMPPEESSPGERGDIRSQASDTSVIRVKSAESSRYSVQVGSYPQLAEATRVVDRWKGKGYPAYMMIADIPDRGRWYRVRIGGFSSRDDASRYLKEFQTRENVEALIVMNEQ